MRPPLLAGEGWGGVALGLKIKSHPLPASSCKQGEEQIQIAAGLLLMTLLEAVGILKQAIPDVLSGNFGHLLKSRRVMRPVAPANAARRASRFAAGRWPVRAPRRGDPDVARIG